MNCELLRVPKFRMRLTERQEMYLAKNKEKHEERFCIVEHKPKKIKLVFIMDFIRLKKVMCLVYSLPLRIAF